MTFDIDGGELSGVAVARCRDSDLAAVAMRGERLVVKDSCDGEDERRAARRTNPLTTFTLRSHDSRAGGAFEASM